MSSNDPPLLNGPPAHSRWLSWLRDALSLGASQDTRDAERLRAAFREADAAREAAVRALAEQRLAEESYRKLFEGSVDGIYITTPKGRLLNCNPALARIMGYDNPST